ncbi:MAG: ACT domain-containing protein [Clostridium sp.]|nr:ACT domain-containing protein [Clostridium sp.]
MKVKQISVFLENKPGSLAEFTNLLQKKHIDMVALSVAEAEDFGIARLLVNDVLETVNTLKDNGYVCSLTPVLAVEIEDKPGALVRVLDLLGDAGINLEYMYAFLTRKADKAFMVLRVADNEQAIKILTSAGIRPLCQDDLVKLF